MITTTAKGSLKIVGTIIALGRKRQNATMQISKKLKNSKAGPRDQIRNMARICVSDTKRIKIFNRHRHRSLYHSTCGPRLGKPGSLIGNVTNLSVPASHIKSHNTQPSFSIKIYDTYSQYNHVSTKGFQRSYAAVRKSTKTDNCTSDT